MRKLRPIRGKMMKTVRLYTYGQLDERRAGTVWWSDETKAYDEARDEMRTYMMNRGEPDPEEADCPDEEIEFYADGHELLFDDRGCAYEPATL